MSAVGPSSPSPYDTGWFADEDDLDVPAAVDTRAEEVQVLSSLVRADLSGTRPGAVLRSIAQAGPADRARLAERWTEVMQDDGLVEWIEASPSRRAKAVDIACALAPPDPSRRENAAVDRVVDAFTDWGSYPHDVIIVPGYTPLDAEVAQPGVHPIARERLEQALHDLQTGKAPFILVSGANVYPAGTPYYEALEMKKALIAMGAPADRIIVDARARHSTTNLRNAGRYMLEHGLRRGLITTSGGGIGGTTLFDQDFYFSFPNLSTFHARSERDLGYRVGQLTEGDDTHTLFVPSADVRRPGFRDPLDP